MGLNAGGMQEIHPDIQSDRELITSGKVPQGTAEANDKLNTPVVDITKTTGYYGNDLTTDPLPLTAEATAKILRRGPAQNEDNGETGLKAGEERPKTQSAIPVANGSAYVESVSPSTPAQQTPDTEGLDQLNTPLYTLTGGGETTSTNVTTPNATEGKAGKNGTDTSDDLVAKLRSMLSQADKDKPKEHTIETPVAQDLNQAVTALAAEVAKEPENNSKKEELNGLKELSQSVTNLSQQINQVKIEITNQVNTQVAQITAKMEESKDKLAGTVNHYYMQGGSVFHGTVGAGTHIEVTNTASNFNTGAAGISVRNTADHGSTINNGNIVDAGVNLGILDLNAMMEEAENLDRLADEPEAPTSLSEAARDTADKARELTEDIKTRKTDRVTDPAVTPDSSSTTHPPVIKPQPNVTPNDNPPTPPQPAVAVTDDSSEHKDTGVTPEEQPTSDPKKAAENLVGPLTPEESQEFDNANEKKGFLFSIKRMFSGENWKRWVPTVIGSIAGSFGVKLFAGAALSMGPIGTALLGGAMAGFAIYSGYRAIKNLSEAAKAEGKSVWQVMGNLDFVKGALLGGLISGVGKASAKFIPGFGSLMALGLEGGTSWLFENHLNKKQQELVNKYMDTYQARRYANLKDKGYVIRGAEGAPAVGMESILKDMTSAPSESEKKVAKRAALASLIHLYSITKDDAHKFVEYTIKENGVDKVIKVDITQIAIDEAEGSTEKYRMLQLKDTDKINVEKFIDTLDTAKLTSAIQDAWNKTDATKRADMAKDLVNLFVGLEGTEVEKIMSEERKSYLSWINFTTGLHFGMAAVNVGSSLAGAYGAFRDNFGVNHDAQGVNTSDSQQATEDYRSAHPEAPQAEVERVVNAEGHIIDKVDVDGGGVDYYVDQTTNQYVVLSGTGAESVFEIQHPDLGQVTATEVTTHGDTGIVATLSDNAGKVVGVTYADSTGHIGVLDMNGVGQHLFAGGGESPIHGVTLTDIQPNGDATLVLDNVNHQVNLGNLNLELDGSSTSEVQTQIGVLMPQSGDSVNSMLHHTIEQAKTLNPNLQQYDNLELERMLYQEGSGIHANDAAIRQELGIRGALDVSEEWSWKDSPTIMSWLTELNGGNTVELGSQTVTGGTPGVNTFFEGPEVSAFDVANAGSAPGESGGFISVMDRIVEPSLLALVGGVMAGVFASQPKSGGISRQNDVNTATAKAGDDKTKDDKGKGVSKETSVELAAGEGAVEKKVGGPKDVIVNQILKNVIPNKYVEIAGKKYIQVESAPGQWKEKDVKDAQPISAEDLADLLLNQTDKNLRSKDLSGILNSAAIKGGATIKLTEEDGSETTYKKSVKDNEPGKRPVKLVSWINTETKKSSDVLTSDALATKILDLKEKTVTVSTPSGSPQGGPSAEAGGDETKKEGEVDKEKALKETLNNILETLHIDKKQVVINGEKYEYNKDAKIWIKSGALFNKNLIQKGSDNLSDQQVVESWIKLESKQLGKDLETTLGNVDSGKKINVIDEIFSKTPTSVLKQANYNGDVYTYDSEKDVWNKDKKSKTASPKSITGSGMTTYIANGTANALPSKKENLIWKSDTRAFNDKDLALEIAKLRVSTKEVKSETKSADSNAEGEKNKEEKEKKESKGRKLLKTALIVLAVAGGITSYAVGGWQVAAITSGISWLTTLGLNIGEGLAQKGISKRQAEAAELAEKLKNEKRALKPDEEKSLEERKRKDERARNIIYWLKFASKVTGALSISSGASALLGLVIDKFQINIKGIIGGAFNRPEINQVPFEQTIDESLNLGK
ncbi:MAG: hypothetical protein UT34_C0001G0333 [candidate division WS6 bacterium GW2011_GWF2_39_15]|uniref:Uncharacterized protein n=1 Tax=candidate division WS6 bacterium GW2011_GWF2_39_15 TaxID=1619100 RepID=A0A0G0MT13_9BACT|nr:MAG: hypothetical protein UT34_C0001G0333 [candidate division WS6 bacterium GW2011_GWF2_39_15]